MRSKTYIVVDITRGLHKVTEVQASSLKDAFKQVQHQYEIGAVQWGKTVVYFKVGKQQWRLQS